MSDKVKALAEKLTRTRKLTQQAREELAKKLFDIDQVSLAITEMAGRGFDTLTVAPGLPLDLRSTEAAKESSQLLTKAGFAVEWHRRQLRADDPETWYMLVTWAKR
ncbi:hypothetical protein [Mesorhizobium sp. M0478]|uniref:hypothetical protein n=1 Tax=Mesorhizobium sp. M0478 TaxID=2956947 RepID=UPI00333AA1E5